MGTADELESNWIPVEARGLTNVHIDESSDADMSYVVQHTTDDPWGSSWDPNDADPQDGAPVLPTKAVRVRIFNFVAGSLSLEVISNTI